MTDRAAPKNTETGFRELFVETRSTRLPRCSGEGHIWEFSKPRCDCGERLRGMTPEELNRRCAALPSSWGLGGNARIDALQDLVLELARGQVAALDLIVRYARCGDHDERVKAWMLDQVTRMLAGEGYAKLVADACAGANGPATYEWDVGIPP